MKRKIAFHLFISLFIAIMFSSLLIVVGQEMTENLICGNCTRVPYEYEYAFIIIAIVLGLFLATMKFNMFKIEMLTLMLWPLWYAVMSSISKNENNDFFLAMLVGLYYTIPIFFSAVVVNLLVIRLSVGKKALKEAYWEERKHWVK